MILIVDDDRLFVSLLTRRLKGCAVRWAPDLAAARRILATGPRCELVFLDLGLPDGHGVHLLTGCAADLSVVVMTGFSPFPNPESMRALGARACVDKDRLMELSGAEMLARWSDSPDEISLTG